MDDNTTREEIADLLYDRDASPSRIADEFDLGISSVHGHLPHVARSVEGNEGERFLVAPPECSDCGFSRFDDPLAAPSKCPSCKSERIEEAVFRIKSV